jgi:hypothetical protein
MGIKWQLPAAGMALLMHVEAQLSSLSCHQQGGFSWIAEGSAAVTAGFELGV